MASSKSKPIIPTSSWRLLPKSYQLFLDSAFASTIVIIVPTFLVQLGSTLMQVSARPLWFGTGIMLQLVGFVFLAVSAAASVLLQVRVVHKQDISLYQLYRDSFAYWLRLVGFGMLFALMLVVGFLLLIIPGLLLLRRYILTPYFIVDEDLGIREAMQRSAAASKPVARHIWTMLLIMVGFSGLGLVFTKLSPEYGGFVTLLFPIIYSYLPALRYQEAAHNLRLSEEK